MKFQIAGNNMKKKLTKEEIRSTLLGIMDEIDRVSKILGIKYFLHAGTLLGAIRHKGFIPWDDDVDLALFRKDYEILVENFNNVCNKRYKLIYFTNTPNYLWNFAKIIDTHTCLREYTINPPFDYGLFVDLFALDYVEFMDQADCDDFYQNIINFSKAKMITIFRYAPHIRKFYNLWIMLHYKGDHRFRYLFANPIDNLKEWDNYVRNYSKGEEKKYMLAVFAYAPPLKWIENPFRTDWYSETINIEFENHMFPVPKGYDGVLKTLYGDYMQLPPPNKRKGEHFKSVTWR